MSEFADWLAKRGDTIEARVRHALLRIQLDALTNALRKANDQCKQLTTEGEVKWEAIAQQAKRGEQCEQSQWEVMACDKQRKASERAKRAVEMAIEDGRANLDEAARKLKRTSSEIGDWRVDVSIEKGGLYNK